MSDQPPYLTLADAVGIRADEQERVRLFHVEQHDRINERLAVLEDLVHEISRLLSDDGK